MSDSLSNNLTQSLHLTVTSIELKQDLCKRETVMT